MYRSAKTAAILAAFMAVSGAAVMMAGCGQEQQKDRKDQQEDVLTDENGRKYELIKNDDGTETAKYENGDEVTFRRDDNDNLQYVSGMSSLLPMLMMSYFLFHGINGYSGHYDRNTGSVLNDRPAYTEQKKNPNYGNTNGSTYQSGKSSGKTTVTAPAGGKTGFGGAGARGGAS
ncbi:hypothetical protein [Dialister sp.]|jgi:hypothetical protein|uniref:hypothetical protein n=1 Tax=Dialister sp. TaxID=1955814 RepID=UPI003A5C039B